MKRHEYCNTCIADNDCPHQRLDEAEYCEVDGVGEWYPSPTIVQQPLSGSPEGSPKVATQPSDNGKRCAK